MSCWVVPTIAAELWGVSLDHLLGRIDEGMVPAKTEHGFLLVDVAPYGEVFRTARWSGPRPRIQTFTVVSAEEYEAQAADPTTTASAQDAGAGEGYDAQPQPEEEPQHHEIADRAPDPVCEVVREEVAPVVVEDVVEDPELGPDPNDEPDDGRPLRWREGRNRAARMRRRPPG